MLVYRIMETACYRSIGPRRVFDVFRRAVFLPNKDPLISVNRSYARRACHSTLFVSQYGNVSLSRRFSTCRVLAKQGAHAEDLQSYKLEEEKKTRTVSSSSRSRRQKTVRVDDLPLHAVEKKSASRSAQTPPRAETDATKDTKTSEKLENIAYSSNDIKTSPSKADELGPEGQAWPPLAKDVLTNMARFPSCILLTRVGGFYESYFEQAPVLANLVGIKLASRTWGGRTVPMAGFPIVQLEKYLKMLVMDHRKLVAVCDEFKDITQKGSVEGDALESSQNRRMSLSRPQSPFAPSASSRVGLNETIQISRRVTRVVSPGTLIDKGFLDPFSSNWIMSIAKVEDKYGIAWLDVSTADFSTTFCDDEQSLRDEVARIGPTEVVLEYGKFTRSAVDPSSTEEQKSVVLETPLSEESPIFLPNDSALWEVLDPAKVHISFIQPSSAAEIHQRTLTPEDTAVTNLTEHLRARLLDIDIEGMEDLTGHDQGPARRRRDTVMTIDASTFSALEINTTMRRDEASSNPLSNTLSARGSLLSHIRRTVTKGGARLLAQWLTAPSTNLPLIHRRQALVALFHTQHSFMTEDLRILLRRRAGDINRALQRLITGRNDEQDLLEVRDFCQMCADVKAQLSYEIQEQLKINKDADEGWTALNSVVQSFENLDVLAERLGSAMDETVLEKRTRLQEDRVRELETNVSVDDARIASGDEGRKRRTSMSSRQSLAQDDETEGDKRMWGTAFEHLIRPSTSTQLSALTKEHSMLRRRAYQLEQELKSKYSEKISLRFLLGQGYVVHLSDVRDGMLKGLNSMEEEMNLAYKSKTTRTYYHERFTKIGSRLGRVELELQEKEAIELQRLRLDVLIELARLRRNAALIHELDVLIGFAALARELNLVKPEVHDKDQLYIKAGRHLGVEMSLLQKKSQTSLPDAIQARPFTPNDVLLDAKSRLHLITGPNMGGKSTVLRMVAIISILAQIGSFVPAEHCSIGVVDQIFSRIGAHDAIHADRSTFMVEMLEVAQFLRRSTSKSLILCDEVGRGTDHKTGAALAYATAFHLVDSVRCKCLFATHLHDVGDLLSSVDGVDYFCTDLEQTDSGEILFSHRLRPGFNRDSHGLDIARLAGLPQSVLLRASDTLATLNGADVPRTDSSG